MTDDLPQLPPRLFRMPRIDEPSPANPDLTVGEAIVFAVRTGNKKQTAAAWAGIHPDTLGRWLKRGAEELTRMARENLEEPQRTETPYVVLYLDLHQAEAEAEVRISALWQAQIAEDWRAGKEFMVRRFESWAESRRVELSGPGGGAIPVGAGVLSLEEAEALAAEIEAQAAVAAIEVESREA